MSATDLFQERAAPSPSLARSMARGATASTSLGVMVGLVLAAVGALDAAWSVAVTAISAALIGVGLGALGHVLVDDAAAPVDRWPARAAGHDG